jgi:hypothetical protein
MIKTFKITWGTPCRCQTIWSASWNFASLYHYIIRKCFSKSWTFSDASQSLSREIYFSRPRRGGVFPRRSVSNFQINRLLLQKKNSPAVYLYKLFKSCYFFKDFYKLYKIVVRSKEVQSADLGKFELSIIYVFMWWWKKHPIPRHWTYPVFEDIISYPLSRPKKWYT